MSNVPLGCNCGSVKGTAMNVTARAGNRVICYCNDCQAFANHLDCTAPILDEHGGTDIFQLPPANIEISQGLELIRCIRLTKKGTHRWYTSCCNTPIGNTMGAGVPFIGVIHNFMDCGANREQILGPVLAKVQGQHAKESLPSEGVSQGFPLGITLRIMWKILLWKLGGKAKPNPFFDIKGAPISEPRILSAVDS